MTRSRRFEVAVALLVDAVAVLVDAVLAGLGRAREHGGVVIVAVDVLGEAVLVLVGDGGAVEAVAVAVDAVADVGRGAGVDGRVDQQTCPTNVDPLKVGDEL